MSKVTAINYIIKKRNIINDVDKKYGRFIPHYSKEIVEWLNDIQKELEEE